MLSCCTVVKRSREREERNDRKISEEKQKQKLRQTRNEIIFARLLLPLLSIHTNFSPVHYNSSQFWCSSHAFHHHMCEAVLDEFPMCAALKWLCRADSSWSLDRRVAKKKQHLKSLGFSIFHSSHRPSSIVPVNPIPSSGIFDICVYSLCR